MIPQGTAIAAEPSAHYQPGESPGPIGGVIPLSALGQASIGLTVENVERKPLPRRIIAMGKIEAIPTRQFAQHALLSGRVKDVRVMEGDTVKAGDVIVIVDSPEITQLAAETVREKEALEAEIARKTEELEAEVRQCKTEFDRWTLTYNRDRKLYDEGIAPLRQWQESLAELNLCESRLNNARRQRDITVASLKVQLQVARDSLSHRLKQKGVPPEDLAVMFKSRHTVLTVPVRSERGGIVTDTLCTAGQSIDPTDVLAQISDLSVVWAKADVYEEDMARIQSGQKVSIKVPAFPGEIFPGSVSYVGREVNPQTRTLPVRVAINNPQLKLKPDMFAELSIDTAEPTMSILVPSDAVVDRVGHHLVFVETQGGFRPTQVKVGRTIGDNMEILAGLHPGQRVVVRGAFQLAAELVRLQGRGDQFVQPTEGERFHEPAEAHTEKPGTLSPQVLTVFTLCAFLLGLVVSALATRSAQLSKRNKSHSVPADSETIHKG